jgi:hypothetical protein
MKTRRSASFVLLMTVVIAVAVVFWRDRLATGFSRLVKHGSGWVAHDSRSEAGMGSIAQRDQGTAEGEAARTNGAPKSSSRLTHSEQESAGRSYARTGLASTGGIESAEREVTGATAARLVAPQADVAQRLQRFFNANGIDPAKRDRVVALLENHRAETLDIIDLARKEGVSADDRRQLLLEAFARTQSALQELLGPEVTSDLFTFQGAQRFTDGFASECAARGMPLSDAAFTTIALDLARHCLAAEPPFPCMKEHWAGLIQLHDEKGFAIAEKVLSPEQMVEFRKLWAKRAVGYGLGRPGSMDAAKGGG